jgi:hypothetical protein
VLWHAQTLLREFRGDGHIIALAAEGVSGLDALVLHAATGDASRATLQSTRAVSDDEWAAAVDGLRARGHLDADGDFTESGRAFRTAIEDRTDVLALAPYEALGEAGCSRYQELCGPISKAVAASPLVAERLAAMLRPAS